MTKDEIIIKLKEGYKVTHTYFSKEEYIQLIGNKLIDEKGYILPWNEFWSFRNARMFELGWELYDKEPDKREIAAVYENAIEPAPDYVIEITKPAETIQATGAMPGLEWLFGFFKRKTSAPRKLTRKERMEEYYKDSGIFD